MSAGGQAVYSCMYSIIKLRVTSPMRIAAKYAKFAAIFASITILSLAHAAGQAAAIPTTRLINPEDLAKLLQTPGKEKPLMIQVGSHVLFSQAHIPGSEYIGPASTESGV